MMIQRLEWTINTRLSGGLNYNTEYPVLLQNNNWYEIHEKMVYNNAIVSWIKWEARYWLVNYIQQCSKIDRIVEIIKGSMYVSIEQMNR